MPGSDETRAKKVILLAPENHVSGSNIVSLPHPKSNKQVKFLVTKEGKLYEIKRQKEELSSWFVDDNVQQDGSLIVTSQFDPLFIILPCLMDAKPGKFVLLDQIITELDPTFKDCFKDDLQMSNIAEVTGTGEFKAFRYSEDKTLEWLKKKTERLSNKIAECGLFVHEKGDDESCDEIGPIRFACGMISEYLDKSVAKKLTALLKIPEKTEKRKSCGVTSSAKKIKTEAAEDYSKMAAKSNSETKTKLTRSQKALSKVDKKGMKSLNAFFKPKTKSAN